MAMDEMRRLMGYNQYKALPVQTESIDEIRQWRMIVCLGMIVREMMVRES